MRTTFFALLAALSLMPLTLRAAEQSPELPIMPMPESLAELQWIARPVIVFADTPNDPRFIQQMQRLTARPAPLIERDVVVITDTDPAARSPLRQELRPRGFSMVLIGKDGQVKLRKPAPWDVRELTRVIDKSPIRQQEVKDRLN
ncbi:MAG: DUF4174 domain-containing protein [Mangrovicoccus sp.]